MSESYTLVLNSQNTNYTNYFTASIALYVMTVTVAPTSGVLGLGSTIYGLTNSITYITAFGTGTGGTGTYTVNITQNVASQQMSASVIGVGSQVYDMAGGKAGYKYNIAWDAILPRKYEKFNVKFVLKSLTGNTILFPAQVSVNFGRTNTYEPNTQSTKLGIIYPMTIGQSNNIYSCFMGENPDCTIAYPSNQIITVSFSNFQPNFIFTMYDYVLMLNFTPITD